MIPFHVPAFVFADMVKSKNQLLINMAGTKNQNQYVIGVDGGATKTHVALADIAGKIIAQGFSGPASPRDPGIKISCRHIAFAIKQALKGKKGIKIVSTVIGMPRIQEEYKNRRREIIGQLKKNKGVAAIFDGEVAVEPDQAMAFRAGTEEKNGISIISGSGFAVHGWNNGHEAKIGGWGWLLTTGSGRWIGREVYRAIVEGIDGRGPKTKLQKMVFDEFNFKDVDGMIDFIYKDPPVNLPKFSRTCDAAVATGDPVAKKIMKKAGFDAAQSLIIVAKQLDFRQQKIPTVVVGGVFNSKLFHDEFLRNLGKEKSFDFLLIRSKYPVVGAIKMALANAKK
jgi:N-acetylglucosamine kinase-like BadF-type ATPase